MNAPSFTPGPWRRDGHRQVTTRGGLPICDVFSGAVGIEQTDANEDLIAAARTCSYACASPWSSSPAATSIMCSIERNA